MTCINVINLHLHLVDSAPFQSMPMHPNTCKSNDRHGKKQTKKHVDRRGVLEGIDEGVAHVAQRERHLHRSKKQDTDFVSQPRSMFFVSPEVGYLPMGGNKQQSPDPQNQDHKDSYQSHICARPT